MQKAGRFEFRYGEGWRDRLRRLAKRMNVSEAEAVRVAVAFADAKELAAFKEDAQTESAA